MGTFRFSEFSLSPRAHLEEPSHGGFEIKESWIGFQWERDESLNGELSFGSSDLVAPAIWYLPGTDPLSLVQAAVKGRTPYFDIRAGLLSIPNGYEGSFPEWEWQLPTTRVRSHRWFIRRDYGLEVKSEVKPFLTSLTFHNGESGTNLDDRMWTTFLWRFLASDGYGILATAEVGQTDPRSALTSAAAIAKEGFQLDPNESAKLRHGSLAFFKKWRRSLILLEGGRGEILQKDEKRPFDWGHLDVCANLGGDLNLLFRYEHSQSDLKTTETMMKSTGLGFSVSSTDRLSSVILWANKTEGHGHEGLLIFHLSSNYL